MITPFPFQEECIDELIDYCDGRGLLSAEMGLGKSLMSMVTMDRLDAYPILIVCPASLKWTWVAEVRKVLGRRAWVAEGRKYIKDIRIPAKAKVVIVNYEIADAWSAKLKRFGFQSVIIDECQYMANHNTGRTKAVKRICHKIGRVVALSGTPLVNRPIELYPVLHLLDRKTFGGRRAFGMRYCGPTRGYCGWEFKGRSNTRELHELLTDTVMVRRRKVDVLPDLPPKIRQVVPLDIRRRHEYERATGDFLSWVKETDPDKLRGAKKATQLVKTGALISLAARLKLKATVEWINQCLADNPEEKLVVFATHRKMIEALGRRVAAPSVTIDGRTPTNKRQVIVDQFQSDPKTRVFLGNLQAASTGLTLTAANRVIFTELGWRPGDHIQAEDRCHRISQLNTVWVHYLVAHNTLEETLCEVLQKKQETISLVLDGHETDEDLDIFDQLLKEVIRHA